MTLHDDTEYYQNLERKSLNKLNKDLELTGVARFSGDNYTLEDMDIESPKPPTNNNSTASNPFKDAFQFNATTSQYPKPLMTQPLPQNTSFNSNNRYTNDISLPLSVQQQQQQQASAPYAALLNSPAMLDVFNTIWLSQMMQSNVGSGGGGQMTSQINQNSSAGLFNTFYNKLSKQSDMLPHQVRSNFHLLDKDFHGLHLKKNFFSKTTVNIFGDKLFLADFIVD